MEMLLLGLILASLGCFVTVIVFTKKWIKGSKNFKKNPLKQLKTLELNNGIVPIFHL